MSDLQTEIVSALNQVIKTQEKSLNLQEELLRQSMHMTNQLFGALHYTDAPVLTGAGGATGGDPPSPSMETIMATIRPEADKDILGGE